MGDFLKEGMDKMESSVGIRMLEEDLIESVKELKNGSKMFEPEIDEKSVGDQEPKKFFFQPDDEVGGMLANFEDCWGLDGLDFLVVGNLFEEVVCPQSVDGVKGLLDQTEDPFHVLFAE